MCCLIPVKSVSYLIFSSCYDIACGFIFKGETPLQRCSKSCDSQSTDSVQEFMYVKFKAALYSLVEKSDVVAK